MRRRTPSEIKAYGDGYAEAYKEFCHLLEKNDKDKAIRKMELFAKAVEITVETATDEPQTETKTETQKSNLSFETDTPIFIHGKSVDNLSISSSISDLTKLKTEMTELGKE